MTVEDVEVKEIDAGAIDFGDLGGELGEIGGEDRRGDLGRD